MGNVSWGFTSSLDGFIAGPDHDMDWLSAVAQQSEPAGSSETDVTTTMAAAVGAIISGRRGYDAARAQAAERDPLTAEAYGGALAGTEFVLTHRPEELAADPTVVALNCDVADAIDRAREASAGRDVQIISADIARQALEKGLIDELQIFVAPVFLGDGTRIFDVPGGRRIDWELTGPIPGAERYFGRTYRPRRT